ncbi:unnamed protein product [Ectocarpus sp. 6 AP-2014]
MAVPSTVPTTRYRIVGATLPRIGSFSVGAPPTYLARRTSLLLPPWHVRSNSFFAFACLDQLFGISCATADLVGRININTERLPVRDIPRIERDVLESFSE